MSKFGVSPEKAAALEAEMARLGIREQDLEENFVRGTGAGGQKINKTSSCVQLRHLPSGIEVRCQRERSQPVNRYLARRELCERLQARATGEVTRRDRERSKIRRQKARRSRRQKEKVLQDKRQRGERKSSRRKDRISGQE